MYIMANSTKISITAWNMRTLRSAAPYINKLMSTSDILILSEHRLYNSEMYKLNELNTDYVYYGKASHDLNDKALTRMPGHCGIAMCWKKSLDHRVRVIENPSDRICIIEVTDAILSSSLFIIGVYLPQKNCRISNFEDHIKIVDDQLQKLQKIGQCIIMGDFNCHFGKEYGPRFCGGLTSINGRKLIHIIHKHDLHLISGSKITDGSCNSL